MRLTKEERETVTSIVLVVVSLFLTAIAAKIPIKNETFMQSARVFPVIVTAILSLLSILYFATSVRKSKGIRLQKLKGVCAGFIRSEETRRIALAILFVAIYIVFGMISGLFYIASAVFMLFILLFYVRRVKPVVSVLSSIAFIGGIYYLFAVVFMVPIK